MALDNEQNDDERKELCAIYNALSDDLRYLLLCIARRLIKSSKCAHKAPESRSSSHEKEEPIDPETLL